MFLFKKKTVVREYDKANWEPVLRKSICTGETTAGFRNIHTGKFREDMLIRDSEDLDMFMRLYGLTDVPETIY